MGLAFGAGLLRYIGDAYRYLMSVYEEGDQVYLFGFSRGAYTVRAIAGVLHMFGLLYPGNDGLIPYIIQLYAKKTREAAGMTHTFRSHPASKLRTADTAPPRRRMGHGQLDRLGLGPPEAPLHRAQSGWHTAVTLHRRAPLLLSQQPLGSRIPGQTIKHVWFSGVHSDVGGSYLTPECGLSQSSLQWMLCEAASLDLLVDPQRANSSSAESESANIDYSPIAPNPRQAIHKSLRGFWWLLELLPHSYYDDDTKKEKWRIPFGSPRTIPRFCLPSKRASEDRRGSKLQTLQSATGLAGLSGSRQPLHLSSTQSGASSSKIPSTPWTLRISPSSNSAPRAWRPSSKRKHDEASLLFMQAWDQSRDDYEACIAAHYVARHQLSS